MSSEISKLLCAVMHCMALKDRIIIAESADNREQVTQGQLTSLSAFKLLLDTQQRALSVYIPQASRQPKVQALCGCVFSIAMAGLLVLGCGGCCGHAVQGVMDKHLYITHMSRVTMICAAAALFNARPLSAEKTSFGILEHMPDA